MTLNLADIRRRYGRALQLLVRQGDDRDAVLSRAAESVHDVPALLTEVERFRDAVLHVLALAPDEYRQAIIAARASMSSRNYAQNNGRAEAYRLTATALAERAGLPVPDWDQIRRAVPSDGVYRESAETTA